MPASKTLPEPSTTDPLAHPTVGMRLHAAYLRAGFTRAAFVQALRESEPELEKLSYGTVMSWESGALPGLIALAAVAKLVGYSMDELFHGDRPARQRKPSTAVPVPTPTRSTKPEPRLDADAIAAVLDEVGATDDEREALGEYSATPAGKFATYTRKFVVEFCRLYSDALTRRRAHPQAMIEAARGARRARATSTAIALGGKPISGAKVAKIGVETRKHAAKRKR